MSLSGVARCQARIRVLSAIEVTIGQLLADEVTTARRDYGLSYRSIGEAAGLSDSSAHKRWKDTAAGTRVEPRRHVRRGSYLLRALGDDSLVVLHEVLDQVSKRVRSDESGAPWSDVVRWVLSYVEKTPYSETQRKGESVFHLTELDFFFRCTEPTQDGGGSVTGRNQWDSALLVDWEPHFDGPRGDQGDAQDALIEFVKVTVAAVRLARSPKESSTQD